MKQIFLVFSARQPVRVGDLKRLRNLEAVVENVSIFVFQFSLYMLKQFRQKHQENHKHGYYRPT